MAEKVWTHKQEIDAAAKVFTAVSELLNGESHLSSKYAIIAAHNTNAKRLQCELTEAVELLRRANVMLSDTPTGCAPLRMEIHDCIKRNIGGA